LLTTRSAITSYLWDSSVYKVTPAGRKCTGRDAGNSSPGWNRGPPCPSHV